jgi:hypothetical protein
MRSIGSGAICRNATPEAAKIFYEIMHAVCFVQSVEVAQTIAPLNSEATGWAALWARFRFVVFSHPADITSSSVLSWSP